MKKDFSKDIIDKIKKEDIKQTSKKFFYIKYLFIWLFFLISIILWWLSFGIILEYYSIADWSIRNRIWLFNIAMTYLPFFWLLFLFISTLIAYFDFKQTPRWYKYWLLAIFWANLFLSFLIGIVFFFLWISDRAENYTYNTLHKYSDIMWMNRESRMIQVWQDEESWLLIWEVIDVKLSGDGLTKVRFKDSNNKEWNLIVDEYKESWGLMLIEVWNKVKLVGYMADENTFIVEQVRPYRRQWMNWERMKYMREVNR